MPKIDWITSAKPCETDADFWKTNCLLDEFHHSDCNLIVVNSRDEADHLPEMQEFTQRRLVRNKRPTLYDLLNQSDADFLILSNADVRVFSSVPLSRVLENQVGMSVSRRYDVEFIEFANDLETANSLAKKFGYLQSRFTLDLFAISREFRDVLLEKEWVKQYSLGQPGVDMALLDEAFKSSKVNRLDSEIILLHRNHEDFKVAFRPNIILNHLKNRKFSQKRKEAFNHAAVSMVLCSFPKAFVRNAHFRKFASRLDMLTVRLRNKFQFAWSRRNFARGKRIVEQESQAALVSHCGFWFFKRVNASRVGTRLDPNSIRNEVRRQHMVFFGR